MNEAARGAIREAAGAARAAPAAAVRIGRRRATIGYGLASLVAIVVAMLFFFPLYWVLVTSFKQPVQVFGGPFYIPFVDFQPTLDAWQYVLVTTGGDTLRPYVNSLIVASASTALASFIGPRGICEDAPCCGCCGPQGDGRIYDEPSDLDIEDDDRWYGGYYDDEDEEPMPSDDRSMPYDDPGP